MLSTLDARVWPWHGATGGDPAVARLDVRQH
jgi:hypothetical protein